MPFALCHIKGEPQTLIKIEVYTMHDFGVGLLWAQVTHCVKVVNDTFKVMQQHNYIIIMVTEVETCVSYLQLKVPNQHNTYFETTKVVTHV